MDEPLFTVEEVAERLKVHPESVRRWLRDGRMRGFRMARRAGWRIADSEVRRFLEESTQEGKLAA